MHYNKPPISFQDQVNRLKIRGLQFNSEPDAIVCLSNISYYRLRAYVHHGRLWNRRFTAHIKFPSNPQNQFVTNKRIYPYKLYAAICCIQYMLNTITPTNGFKTDLVELMKDCPLAQEKEMGLPVDWKTDPFWK